jgi:hypothetical protein
MHSGTPGLREQADKDMIIDHITSMGTMEDANQKVLGMVRASIKNMPSGY